MLTVTPGAISEDVVCAVADRLVLDIHPKRSELTRSVGMTDTAHYQYYVRDGIVSRCGTILQMQALINEHFGEQKTSDELVTVLRALPLGHETEESVLQSRFNKHFSSRKFRSLGLGVDYVDTSTNKFLGRSIGYGHSARKCDFTFVVGLHEPLDVRAHVLGELYTKLEDAHRWKVVAFLTTFLEV